MEFNMRECSMSSIGRNNPSHNNSLNDRKEATESSSGGGLIFSSATAHAQST